MTRRLAGILLLTLLATLPLHADFASIARAIDAKSGVSRRWIPFLGVARLFVRMADPSGVHDFQLATFSGAERLDAQEMQRIMRTYAGAGFSPLVQARSKKSGEWSFIYARPSKDGNRFELIVLTRDSEDTVLVRVEVDAEVLSREIGDEPRNVTRVAAR